MNSLADDSAAALMGSWKTSQTHSCFCTHLHSRTHSQFTCAVRLISFTYPHSSAAAESHSFVSPAQGGENSLTPLFGAWQGHMTTKWWRLSAVGELSIPDAERYRHTSMIWNPRQETELCLSRGGECTMSISIRGWRKACCYLKTCTEMGGKEGGMGICLWCIFGSGRGLASASSMMQDTGSCFCLSMDRKWVFVMLNTGTCFIVIRFQAICTADLLWSLFKLVALHVCLIYLPMCVRLCVCKCECVWTLRRKSDSQRREEREQKRKGLMMMT